MSKTSVRKALKALTAEEITEMVLELYAARKEAKEYLDYWASPDQEKELEKTCTAVRRKFFAGASGTPRRSPALKEVDAMVKNFMTLVYDPEKVAELLFAVADSMADWLEVRYRRLAYRQTLKKYADQTALYIESNALEDTFGLRMERLHARVEALLEFQGRLAGGGRYRRYFRF